jgi:DNA-directed RNA polymerase subunit M/transcription elongation factor TFIIS
MGKQFRKNILLHGDRMNEIKKCKKCGREMEIDSSERYLKLKCRKCKYEEVI